MPTLGFPVSSYNHLAAGPHLVVPTPSLPGLCDASTSTLPTRAQDDRFLNTTNTSSCSECQPGPGGPHAERRRKVRCLLTDGRFRARIIDHIRRAAKYDFDARPHGRLPGAGFEPIPWKHEALQHEVYELVGTVQRLRTVAEERLQWLEDRRQLDLEALGHIRQWALEEASTQAAEYRVAIAATEERYRRLGDAECACPTCAAITGGVWEVRRSLEAVDGVGLFNFLRVDSR